MAAVSGVAGPTAANPLISGSINIGSFTAAIGDSFGQGSSGLSGIVQAGTEKATEAAVGESVDFLA